LKKNRVRDSFFATQNQQVQQTIQTTSQQQTPNAGTLLLHNLLGINSQQQQTPQTTQPQQTPQTTQPQQTPQTPQTTQQTTQQIGILQQLQQASAAAALGSQTMDIRYQSPSQSHQPNFPSVFGQQPQSQTQQQTQQTQTNNQVQALSKQEFQNQLLQMLRNEQFIDSVYQEYLKLFNNNNPNK